MQLLIAETARQQTTIQILFAAVAWLFSRGPAVLVKVVVDEMTVNTVAKGLKIVWFKVIVRKAEDEV